MPDSHSKQSVLLTRPFTAMNYRSSEWLDPRIESRLSPISGRGLFAGAPINDGEPLVIWGGQVFTADDLDAGKAARGSTVAIGEDLYLGSAAGAYDRERDDRGDFINHSCDLNVWMADEVTLVARRDVAKDEELTMDYSMIEADERHVNRWQCNCGSSLCRGKVTGLDWRLPALQARYAGSFSPFINRRIDAQRNRLRVDRSRLGL